MDLQQQQMCSVSLLLVRSDWWFIHWMHFECKWWWWKKRFSYIFFSNFVRSKSTYRSKVRKLVSRLDDGSVFRSNIIFVLFFLCILHSYLASYYGWMREMIMGIFTRPRWDNGKTKRGILSFNENRKYWGRRHFIEPTNFFWFGFLSNGWGFFFDSNYRT